MKTSGLAEPPEMVVTRLARLVSVLLGADCKWTLIFGCTFSNALISTVRGSGWVVVIGLAHQTIVPLLGLPFGFEPPLAVVAELPHAARVSAEVAASAVTSSDMRPPRVLVGSTIMAPSFLYLLPVIRYLVGNPLPYCCYFVMTLRRNASGIVRALLWTRTTGVRPGATPVLADDRRGRADRAAQVSQGSLCQGPQPVGVGPRGHVGRR